MMLLIIPIATAGSMVLSAEILATAEEKNGPMAKNRLLAWQTLVNKNKGEPELVKLRLVNEFFNQVSYSPDQDQWGQRNYWATPVDFLIANAGDCEDFALAKYYTLVQLGVPTNKLRLTYVKSLRLNQAHMVLTYYETPGEEPFILDNLQKRISYASERGDLQPVYSFNGDGLWITKDLANKRSGKAVGEGNKMTLWLDWRKRMQQVGLD